MKMKDVKRLAISNLVGFFSFMILWQLLHLLLKIHIVPSPIETVAYMLTVPATLLKHCTASILRVAAAISISLILGTPAGIALGVSKTCSRLFGPLLYFIYPIPKVAFSAGPDAFIWTRKYFEGDSGDLYHPLSDHPVRTGWSRAD